MRHYDTLTWPQNAGNHIPEELNFKHFPDEDASGPLIQGNVFSGQPSQGPLSTSRKYFLEVERGPWERG